MDPSLGLDLMPDNSGWLSSPLEDRDECSLVTICQSGTEAGIDWEKGAESKLQSMGS